MATELRPSPGFLVQHLVGDDSAKSSSSDDDRHSDSSSEPGAPAPAFPAFPGAELQLQYMQMAMAASLGNFPGLLPPAFLYPQLFPDLNRLRIAMQSPSKESVVMSSPQAACPGTPDSDPTLSPSPRKRPASQARAPKASPGSPTKKPRATRRLQLDADTASPVSGMFIKDADAVPSAGELQAVADLDESAKFVVVSEEAKAELARIPNEIGDYVCRLCLVKYSDCFGLAQHRCPRIVHQEYRCSECDKVFSCPANLASHKRWHKPRAPKPPPSYEAATNNPHQVISV